VTDIAANGILQEVSGQRFGFDDRGDNFLQQLSNRSRYVFTTERRFHGPTVLMPHHNDQPHAQILDRVFQTRLLKLARYVAGHADYKQVSLPLIKDHFRGHSGVRTPQNRGKRILPLRVPLSIFVGCLSTLAGVLQVTPVTLQNPLKCLFSRQPLPRKIQSLWIYAVRIRRVGHLAVSFIKMLTATAFYSPKLAQPV
jgi:hypothetical protein